MDQFIFPKLKIRIGYDLLEEDIIKSFEFVADEDALLPRCVIRFKDNSSKRITEFNGLSIGSRLTFTVIDNSAQNRDKKLKFNFTPLVIGALASRIDDFVSNNADIELLCEHPWKMFQDFSSHAYASKTNSEIIKGLVENNSKGFEFEKIDTNLFLDSDESGNIPRYKCGESDLDFIVKKLLPYTTINKKPPLFWIDEVNRVRLSTFNEMYSKESIAIGLPDDDGVVKGEKLEGKGSKYNNNIITLKKIRIDIGDEDTAAIIKTLKAECSFEDPMIGKTFTGVLSPKIAIGKFKSTEGMQTGFLPLSQMAMLTANATDKKFFIHRNLDDQIALATNTQEIFNRFFKIEVEANFCADILKTGDNIDIYSSKIKTKHDTLTHWVNGKWHVKAVRHCLDIENYTLYSKLTLIRPSFVFNTKNTSIFDFTQLYGVM